MKIKKKAKKILRLSNNSLLYFQKKTSITVWLYFETILWKGSYQIFLVAIIASNSIFDFLYKFIYKHDKIV